MAKMKSVLLFLLFFAAELNCGAAEFVGFQNIALKPGERIWSFEVELKEGRIVALSKAPMGWKIALESFGERGVYKDGGGEVRGSAGVGHDAWSPDMLAALGPFLLLDDSGTHHQPAVLSGSVKISGPQGDRTLVLSPENFTRTKTGKQSPSL
jgi:hypothetical protein